MCSDPNYTLKSIINKKNQEIIVLLSPNIFNAIFKQPFEETLHRFSALYHRLNVMDKAVKA